MATRGIDLTGHWRGMYVHQDEDMPPVSCLMELREAYPGQAESGVFGTANENPEISLLGHRNSHVRGHRNSLIFAFTRMQPLGTQDPADPHRVQVMHQAEVSEDGQTISGTWWSTPSKMTTESTFIFVRRPKKGTTAPQSPDKLQAEK